MSSELGEEKSIRRVSRDCCVKRVCCGFSTLLEVGAKLKLVLCRERPKLTYYHRDVHENCNYISGGHVCTTKDT